MKKLLIGISATVLLLLGSIYFLIQKNNTVISEIKPACSIGTVQRITGSSDYRIKWLPKAGKTVSATEYIFDGCTFLFAADNSFNNNVTVKYKNVNTNCLFTLEAVGDSVLVKWLFTHQSSNNPISRFTDYFALKHIKATNQKILQSMLAFLNGKKNVYGFDVSLEKQADSTLISLKAASTHYPTVADIYTNIEKLNQYAVANGANTTNAPMLNITKGNAGNWLFMVALPIDKLLNDKGNIIAKRMFAGGKILITENIMGGFNSIENALNNLEKFRSDYGYMSPAIPYQSLVTDRTKETDSTKWATKLYYPVY